MAASILKNGSFYSRIIRPSLTTFCSKMRMHNLDPGVQSQKTTVTIMNKETEYGIMIDAFSIAGFRLNNGLNVLGPMAVFPRSILHWNIKNVEDINEDSLSLFCLIEPKLDILVLGIGDAGNRLNPEIIKYLRKKKINLEVLPTEQACATFNFLNAENRFVAAGLIPPVNIKMSEDDLSLASQRAALSSESEKDWLM